MQKYHIIYRTTNTTTNEYYIGMHSTNNPLDDGYMGSGTRIKQSIEKHGAENHKCEILEYCDTRDTLYKREAQIVCKKKILDPLCLNRRRGGGKNGFTVEQQKENNRRSLIAQKKLSKTDPEWRARRSRRLSDANLLAYKEGRRQSTVSPHFPGEFKHSEETKIKMSELKHGKNTGKSNPSFGTCWIYSDKLKQNKRINKVDLNHFLKGGWIKGRKTDYYGAIA